MMARGFLLHAGLKDQGVPEPLRMKRGLHAQLQPVGADSMAKCQLSPSLPLTVWQKPENVSSSPVGRDPSKTRSTPATEARHLGDGSLTRLQRQRTGQANQIMSDRFIHAEDHMRGCLYYGDKAMLFGNDKRGPEERSPLPMSSHSHRSVATTQNASSPCDQGQQEQLRVAGHCLGRELEDDLCKANAGPSTQDTRLLAAPAPVLRMDGGFGVNMARQTDSSCHQLHPPPPHSPG
jgi:hypothetical protein